MNPIIAQQIQDTERYMQPMRYYDARACMDEPANDPGVRGFHPLLVKNVAEECATIAMVAHYCSGEHWRDHATVQRMVEYQKDKVQRKGGDHVPSTSA